jgi:probable F420-dependent oxidoreductase
MAAMDYGIDLGRCNPRGWLELAARADELGFESVWLPEHLIFPAEIAGSPTGDDAHGRIDPDMPVFDAFAMLGAIAARTTHIRLGTNVFNIGLRHPFITARGAATVDVISNGRFVLGIGASWLAGEWEAVGLDFATRGARVDEAIEVCRRLWTESRVAYDGVHFHFDTVAFEPKPVQRPIPVHVGGDSPRALRRAAEMGDGWIAMVQTPATFAVAVESLRARCDAAGRDFATFDRSALVANPDAATVQEWEDAGATRLIVAPWARSSVALDGIAEFAARMGLSERS